MTEGKTEKIKDKKKPKTTAAKKTAGAAKTNARVKPESKRTKSKVTKAKKTGSNELKELSEVIGARAAKLLVSRKAVLKIWRNSTPHNWWVEDKDGNMLWHSHPGFPYPNFKLFTKIEDSPERVVAYWGRDSGDPCLSIYALAAKGK